MPGAENGLSAEVERVAREELGEDPVSRERDVEAVRQWLVKQPGLNARTGT